METQAGIGMNHLAAERPVESGKTEQEPLRFNNSGSTASTIQHAPKLPDFVREITAGQVRARHWRHNATSWMTIPLRCLPRSRMAGTCGVLMYHRVCPQPANRFSLTYSVTPQRFSRQLSGLLRRGYQAVSLEQLVDARSTGAKLADRVFAVTFDDGYANNLQYALPILKQLNIPATIFLATAYIGTKVPFPFDDWMVNAPEDIPDEAWRPLTLDEGHQMLESKLIQFGAHTHTHQDFRHRLDAFDSDLQQCLTYIRREFSIARPAFAYPFGDPRHGFASAELGAIVAKLGCSSAFQTGNCRVQKSDDLYHLPRFDVAAGDNGASLAGKLDGWGEFLRNSLRSLSGRSSHGIL